MRSSVLFTEMIYPSEPKGARSRYLEMTKGLSVTAESLTSRTSPPPAAVVSYMPDE